jgi:beta-glucosidase
MELKDKIATTSRRNFLTGMAGTALVAAVGSSSAALAATTLKAKSFPKNFHWGVATSGHQIEGNDANSDLWLLENIKPTIYSERAGDACNSYHRYEEDTNSL